MIPFVFDCLLDWYKTQEICDKVASKETYAKILSQEIEDPGNCD